MEGCGHLEQHLDCDLVSSTTMMALDESFFGLFSVPLPSSS